MCQKYDFGILSEKCSFDPIPTSLFVKCLDHLLPPVTAIINKSLRTGVYPSVFKEAILKPLLKKKKQKKITSPEQFKKNYRPVSNL